MLNVSRDTPVLIYGAGGDGRHMATVLRDAGARVLGFVDRRAAELKTFCALPVMTVDASVQQAPHALVIVTLKNLFAHEDVAQLLHDKGFAHIVYCPRACLNGVPRPEEQTLQKIYAHLVQQRKPLAEGLVIPEMPEEQGCRLADLWRIGEREGRLVSWVPVEQVFNYAREDTAFGYCNMPLFFPLVGLFRGLLGDRGASQSWREEFFIYSSDWLAQNDLVLSPGQKQSLLESRSAVFQEMQRTFEVDFDFFQRSAPEALMARPGRFELTNSGRNRVAFLMAKGLRMVPLAIERAAYEDWAAVSRAEPLRRLMALLPGRVLFAPVPHPGCGALPCLFHDYARLFLLRVAEDLMRRCCAQHCYVDAGGRVRYDHAAVRESLASRRIVCLLRDGGLAVRYFASLGCRTVRLFDPAWEEQPELAGCMDALFSSVTDDSGSVWSGERFDLLLADAGAEQSMIAELAAQTDEICLLVGGDHDRPVLAGYMEEPLLFDTQLPTGPLQGRRYKRLQ